MERPPREVLALVCAGVSREKARELELVLHSQGMASWVVRSDGAWALAVQAPEVLPARQILRLYEEENRPESRPEPPPAGAVGPAPFALEAAALVGLVLVGFHAWSGGAPGEAAAGGRGLAFAAGSADAARMLAGEPWRAVTALCLHADVAHLASNLVFGGLFLVLAGRVLGPGVALLAFVVSGAAGNLANAWARQAAHVSVGASTAVFGLVGVLCGLGMVRFRRRTGSLRRAVVPVAAGAGLLAMLGSGEGRVDVFAHLFGFLAGLPLGAVAAAPRTPPRALAQILAALAAAALVAISWTRALLQEGI